MKVLSITHQSSVCLSTCTSDNVFAVCAEGCFGREGGTDDSQRDSARTRPLLWTTLLGWMIMQAVLDATILLLIFVLCFFEQRIIVLFSVSSWTEGLQSLPSVSVWE